MAKNFLFTLLILWQLIFAHATKPQKSPNSKIILKIEKGWGGVKGSAAIKNFIKYDIPNLNEKVIVDYEGGGKARFVVRDHEDRDAKVYDVSALSLTQIRQVCEQLGFRGVAPFLSQTVIDAKNLDEGQDENPGMQLKKDLGGIPDDGLGEFDL